MKIKNLIKIILISFFTITPMHPESLSQPTRLRKTSIKNTAFQIISMNENIDQLIRLTRQTKNQKMVTQLLKDVDILKTFRDLKIRELNNLRQ